MGFKADLSFLEKLTMGATATTAAMNYLKGRGFEPVELERYSTSNKIWTTKVKRLRLADVLCVRTGTRFEVRGKSDLKIKMSHSPANPDRRWDSGLRDEDVIALVPCDAGANVHVRGAPVFFSVADLRGTESAAKLGPPKSASEGAERDLTWPSCVPRVDGTVLEVTGDRIRTVLESGRAQTYALKGKVAYVKAGDTFVGEASILAGIVPGVLDLEAVRGRTWNPVEGLASANATDRYVSAKALGWRPTIGVEQTRAVLRAALNVELEHRTALEMATALARLGDDHGFDYISGVLENKDTHAPAYLPMEAMLILAELRGPRAAELLDKVAGNPALAGNELRQAAVWGLGKAGARAYERVLPYLDDQENDVALHAIAALGTEVPKEVLKKLVAMLFSVQSTRGRSAASEALRLIGSTQVVEAISQRGSEATSPWGLATLGRIPRKVLATATLSQEIQRALEPVILLAEGENWLVAPAVATDFHFLLRQNL